MKNYKLRLFLRSFLIQATWNRERMLGLGYCFCLLPFAEKRLRSASRRKKFLTRNLGYFNTHPYLATWVIGAAIKVEEQVLAGLRPAEDVERFRTTLSHALAVTGDDLFWHQLRPITALVGVMVTWYFQFWGLLAFLLLYNAPHLIVRSQGIHQGLVHGFDLVHNAWLQFYRRAARLLPWLSGLLLAGGILAVGQAGVIEGTREIALFLGAGLAMFGLLKLRVPLPYALACVVALTAVLNRLVVSWFPGT